MHKFSLFLDYISPSMSSFAPFNDSNDQNEKMMQEKKEGGVDEPLSPEAEEQPPSARKKKSKSKRRFSDEQVRLLETIFESETKLEPRKKVQVARELGLQPRQVAIWFQNKRARWKSKQIEKNYRLLKANFDNLKARFEAMRREKESLLEQVHELRSLLEKTHERSNGYKDFGPNKEYISRDNGFILGGIQAKSSTLKVELDQQGLLYSDDGKTRSMAHACQQGEPELLNISENINSGSIISPVKWCSYDATGSLFDQSSTIPHWWESWT